MDEEMLWAALLLKRCRQNTGFFYHPNDPFIVNHNHSPPLIKMFTMFSYQSLEIQNNFKHQQKKIDYFEQGDTDTQTLKLG